MPNPKPPSCSGCALDSNGFSFTQNEGTGANGILIVAEAPGEHEDRDGLPLRPYAPAGSIIERTFRRAGIDRQQFAISNTIRCRPSNKNWLEHAPYEFEVISHCKTHMDQTIAQFRPKVIFALGNVPMRTLTGYAGKKQSIMHVRGFYLDNLRYPEIPVLASLHPANIARDKTNLLGVLRADMLRAKQLADAGGKFTRPQKNYICFPPIDVARAWVEELRKHPKALVTYDIETTESLAADESEIRAIDNGQVERTQIKPEYEDLPLDRIPEDAEPVQSTEITTTRITQIQFSYRPYEALVLPFAGDYIQLAQEVLALPNPKMGHNSYSFDQPLLHQANCPVSGIHHDSMLAWHHLQADLPRGLQFVTSFYVPEAEPWKHMADADPGRYGGDDVGYLSFFGPVMLQQLKDRGLWNAYDRQVRQFWPLLTAASERGIPVNDQKRLALREKVLAEQKALGLELQGEFPDALRAVEPKNGYANPKLAVKKMALPFYGLDTDAGERWGLRNFTTEQTVQLGTEHSAGDPYVTEMLAAGWRFVRLQPFKPNSGPQILKWIKWTREKDIQSRIDGYHSQPRYASQPLLALRAMAERTTLWKVPKAYKEEKETTAKVELLRLAKRIGDTFLPRCIEYREMGKLIATYVDGWAPTADQAVHTTFSYAPATGQLAAVRPNALNPMKHGRFAKPFRLMIEAKPGHCLIELDMTAFHARTLGLEAQDAAYMRLAALDIHSFVAAHMLKFPERDRLIDLPDAELKAILKSYRARTELYGGLEFEKIRNEKAKRAILGIGFGLGADKLYNMNQESFANKAEAKKIQDVIRGLFPKVFGFQDAVRRTAHAQGYLDSRWGFRRYFWDVYHWDSRKGGNVPGQDAEACIAFLPSNDAFGMLRDCILRLESRGLLERYGFINTIHDSLMFHCRIEHAEECVREVLAEMQAPCPTLADPVVAPNGFWCGADASVGWNWAEMMDAKKFFEMEVKE